MTTETIVPDPRGPGMQQIVNTSDTAASGLTGWLRQFTAVSIFAFIMFIMYLQMSWGRQDIRDALATATATNERLRDRYDQIWQSMNTANHLMAGVQNSLSEQQTLLRAVKDMLEQSNIQRGMPKEAGLKPGEPAKPPGDSNEDGT